MIARDLVVGGIAEATAAPFHFSTNFEIALARMRVGAARGTLNGGTIGFVQGAATTAVRDTTWEQGTSMGFRAVMANGFETALMGVLIGAPLEAVIAGVRPFEVNAARVDGERAPDRVRGANDEIGPDPRRPNPPPEPEPQAGILAGRRSRITERTLTQDVLNSMIERLPANPDDAAFATVLRELGAGETITPDMIQQARAFVRGDPLPSSRPDWLRRMEAGRQFNRENWPRYEHNEVYVRKASGEGYWILDSYNVESGEIVSRKLTQMAGDHAVLESTAMAYLDELATKYPPGATIADVPSARLRFSDLIGQPLRGNMILEVPVQTNPIPQSILDAATARGIKIRDVTGRVYNP